MASLRDGIVQRGRTWSYVIRVTDHDSGRSRPRWVGGFATEAEAKAARDEARVAARRGEYVDRSRITVAQYLTEWLAGHAIELKPKTRSSYAYQIEHYIAPRIGKLRLQALRASTLTRLYADLLERGGRDGKPLSRRTVDYTHAVLRKALNDAVTVDQLLTSNPALRAKRPKGQPAVKRSDVWSAAELQRFLDIAAGHRLSAFYWLAAYTGARRGELLHLRWPDVDLDRGTVHVRGSVGVVDGERVEGTPKSSHARLVSIDPGTVAELRRHRARQHEERLVAGASWVGGDLVFRRGLGGPLFPDSMTQLMRRLIREHNAPRDGEPPAMPLRPIRLHDLRHTHATLLLEAGVPVHVVSARLGHADPSITLKVYAHVLDTQAVQVARRFADVMSAAQSAG